MTVHVERLVEVSLREVWKDEAAIFTPWLAANPEYLSEAIGMNLEVVGTEMAVGPFSADLVLVETNTNKRVVVENFLEATDHDHLGKLITYAAGLEASYAVLAAKRFRPEHRSALKWLNDVSTPDAGFFGIEVKAVRIGDSAAAVVLEVVVEPDDWQRQVRETTSGQLSEGQNAYIDWWSEFLPALQERYPGWTGASKPQTTNWINLPTGRSGIRYGVSFSWPTGSTDYRLRAEIYMDDGEKYWQHFVTQTSDLERAFPEGLCWEPLESSKASRIAVYLDGARPDRRDEWPTYRVWALDYMGRFRAAFQPIVNAIPV